MEEIIAVYKRATNSVPNKTEASPRSGTAETLANKNADPTLIEYLSALSHLYL